MTPYETRPVGWPRDIGPDCQGLLDIRHDHSNESTYCTWMYIRGVDVLITRSVVFKDDGQRMVEEWEVLLLLLPFNMLSSPANCVLRRLIILVRLFMPTVSVRSLYFVKKNSLSPYKMQNNQASESLVQLGSSSLMQNSTSSVRYNGTKAIHPP